MRERRYEGTGWGWGGRRDFGAISTDFGAISSDFGAFGGNLWGRSGTEGVRGGFVFNRNSAFFAQFPGGNDNYLAITGAAHHFLTGAEVPILGQKGAILGHPGSFNPSGHRLGEGGANLGSKSTDLGAKKSSFGVIWPH